MKAIKRILGMIITLLGFGLLFGVLFVELDIVTLGLPFFIELFCVMAIVGVNKFSWYETAEERTLEQEDLRDLQKNYDDHVDEVITDINDFEDFLPELDKNNYDDFVNSKIGKTTPKTFGYAKYMKILKRITRKSLKIFKTESEIDLENRTKYINHYMMGITPEKLGEEKYNKLVIKIKKKADKIPLLKASDIMTRGASSILYDSRNYQKKKKFDSQLFSTIISMLITIALAFIAFEDFKNNWETLIRYGAYVYTVLQTIVLTYFTAVKNTRKEFTDHIKRLDFMIIKYENKKNKNKGVDENGQNNELHIDN